VKRGGEKNRGFQKGPGTVRGGERGKRPVGDRGNNNKTQERGYAQLQIVYQAGVPAKTSERPGRSKRVVH